MANITLVIPNEVALEALEAVETRWGADARRIFPGYDAMSAQGKMKALLAAMIRVSVKNGRREAAERLISVSEPDVT